jgi:hypothetical protein
MSNEVLDETFQIKTLNEKIETLKDEVEILKKQLKFSVDGETDSRQAQICTLRYDITEAIEVFYQAWSSRQ